MEESKLPYRVEYAKSGRAGCKRCKEPIAKDSVRLAVMVQVSWRKIQNYLMILLWKVPLTTALCSVLMTIILK